MSTLFRTTGIVLSQRDYKEYDKWYSVFTRDRGKVRFLARGGHKPLAKLTPHLEMASEVELLLVNGRLYHTVAGVEKKKSFSNIHNNLSLLLLAQNGLHLVDIGTEEHEDDPEIYSLIFEWIEFLESGETFSVERAGYLLASFALRLMSICGYCPELNFCLGCRVPVEPNYYKWHALKGGVVCNNCCSNDQEHWFNARPMSDGCLKMLRFALSGSFADQLKPRLDAQTIGLFHDAVESLIISHFPTIPASSIKAACNV